VPLAQGEKASLAKQASGGSGAAEAKADHTAAAGYQQVSLFKMAALLVMGMCAISHLKCDANQVEAEAFHAGLPQVPQPGLMQPGQMWPGQVNQQNFYADYYAQAQQV
jgi:hypothetical protein